MEYFKKFGWVLLAGLISFVIFVILLFGLSAVVEYFREQQMLEPRLFFDSFLKPVALIFFSSWAWLAGIFLSKDGPKRWGRILCDVRQLTSAGTATPTTLRLRLHSVGAHAASVMGTAVSASSLVFWSGEQKQRL